MSDEFAALQRQAIEQMKALQSQAQTPPAPPGALEPPKPVPDRPAQRRGFLSRFLHLENDTALLLGLLLFLGREGADEGLLLALLYIMS